MCPSPTSFRAELKGHLLREASLTIPVNSALHATPALTHFLHQISHDAYVFVYSSVICLPPPPGM